jgi:hypothetical protein
LKGSLSNPSVPESPGIQKKKGNEGVCNDYIRSVGAERTDAFCGGVVKPIMMYPERMRFNRKKGSD